jgi:hypothetical protein
MIKKNAIPITYIESGINLIIVNNKNYNITKLKSYIDEKLNKHNIIINPNSLLTLELSIDNIDFGNQAIRLIIGPIDGGVGKLDYILRIYRKSESFVELSGHERFTGLEADYTGTEYINNLGGEDTVKDFLYKNLSNSLVTQLLDLCK